MTLVDTEEYELFDEVTLPEGYYADVFKNGWGNIHVELYKEEELIESRFFYDIMEARSFLSWW